MLLSSVVSENKVFFLQKLKDNINTEISSYKVDIVNKTKRKTKGAVQSVICTKIGI